MTALHFYIGWFRLGRAYWKAQKELQKLEEDCLRWATLAAYIDDGSTGSIADETEAWLAQREDEAA